MSTVGPGISGVDLGQATNIDQAMLLSRRIDDRRVINAIIHVLPSGCRQGDGPAKYGSDTMIYNHFYRRS